VLIGKDGPPKEFHWVVGEKEGKIVSSEPDLPFTVQSDGTSVLELLRNPPWDHFRLEACIVHGNSKDGFAGIVLAHDQRPEGDKLRSSFWTLRFAEEGRWRGVRGLSVGKYGDHFSSVPIFTTAPNFLPAPGTERLVAVEVDGDGVRAYWGAEQFVFAKSTHVKNLQQRETDLLRGGIGLYVKNGQASFRHVIISRLQ
jgi:hypothetical protein